MRNLPKGVAEKIGPYYVYLIIDPITNMPFYVGKGTGERLLQHGIEAEMMSEEGEEPEKIKKIRDLKSRGIEPKIDVLRHNIISAEEALRIEASVIDAFKGVIPLANRIRGFEIEKGREAVQELVFRYGAEPLTTTLPALLITLNSWKDDPYEIPGVPRNGYGWKKDLSLNELYNSNRASWGIRKKDQPHTVVFVYEGLTRAVFTECIWVRGLEKRVPNRSVFSGKLQKEGEVFNAFIGPLRRRVDKKRGSRGSFMYWPRPT